MKLSNFNHIIREEIEAVIQPQLPPCKFSVGVNDSVWETFDDMQEAVNYAKNEVFPKVMNRLLKDEDYSTRCIRRIPVAKLSGAGIVSYYVYYAGLNAKNIFVKISLKDIDYNNVSPEFLAKALDGKKCTSNWDKQICIMHCIVDTIIEQYKDIF